jgi:hypothetical protein
VYKKIEIFVLQMTQNGYKKTFLSPPKFLTENCHLPPGGDQNFAALAENFTSFSEICIQNLFGLQMTQKDKKKLQN